ncbi:hypothetical protein ACHAXM_000065, partial [Skeletonema potamos]
MANQLSLSKFFGARHRPVAQARGTLGSIECPYCFKPFSLQGFSQHKKVHVDKGDRLLKKPKLGKVKSWNKATGERIEQNSGTAARDEPAPPLVARDAAMPMLNECDDEDEDDDDDDEDVLLRTIALPLPVLQMEKMTVVTVMTSAG